MHLLKIKLRLGLCPLTFGCSSFAVEFVSARVSGASYSRLQRVSRAANKSLEIIQNGLRLPIKSQVDSLKRGTRDGITSRVHVAICL